MPAFRRSKSLQEYYPQPNSGVVKSVDTGTRVTITSGPDAGKSGAVTGPASVVRLDGATADVVYTDDHLKVVAPKVKWGAWIDGAVPWDKSLIERFETLVGKQLDYIHFSSNFNYKFDTVAFGNVKANGSVPMFSWAPTGLNIADVANGSKDAYVKTWATAAKNFGSTIILKYSWEMNGTWFSWTNKDPATFKKMWVRHYNIFQSVGATNVKWLFCPNIDPFNKFRAMEEYYPGNGYVQYVGADGYNMNDGTSFEKLFGSTYDRLEKLSSNKKFLVGEVGCSEGTKTPKGQWITDMFAALPRRFPNLHGLVWFNKNAAESATYRVDSSTGSLSAFKAGLVTL